MKRLAFAHLINRLSVSFTKLPGPTQKQAKDAARLLLLTLPVPEDNHPQDATWQDALARALHAHPSSAAATLREFLAHHGTEPLTRAAKALTRAAKALTRAEHRSFPARSTDQTLLFVLRAFALS